MAGRVLSRGAAPTPCCWSPGRVPGHPCSRSWSRSTQTAPVGSLRGMNDSYTEEERNKILDDLAEQRYADFEADVPELTPRGAPIGFDETTDPIGREFGEFYSTAPGYHHNAPTQHTRTSALSFMNFPLLAYIESISPRPILSVVGETRSPGTSARMPTNKRPSRRSSMSSRTPTTWTSTTRPTSSRSTSWTSSSPRT